MRSLALAPLLYSLSVVAAPSAATKPASVLPFHEDDYDKALAEARAKKLPVFVEAWAPW